MELWELWNRVYIVPLIPVEFIANYVVHYRKLKAAFAKIFIRKIMGLKVEKRLSFDIKYVILKQTPLI